MNGARSKPHPRVVCIVLVNWNGWRDTAACLESCARLSYECHVVIVVDNGSTDDSVVQLRQHYPDLHLIETGANLGFAAANNVGMHTALAMGADYVWLLNNDTVVDPDALSALMDVMREDPSVGIAGSKIYYLDRPDTLWFAGGRLSLLSGWPLHRGTDEVDKGQFEETVDVDFATGCSLLARAAAVASLGPMVENYFLYWEDVDWCGRARHGGWRVVYVPESRIWHKVGGSAASRNQRLQWRYQGRNRLLFYWRHRPLALGWIALSTPLSALYLVARGRPRDGLALVQGALDACRGRKGVIRS